MEFKDSKGVPVPFPKDRTYEDINWRTSAYGLCRNAAGEILMARHEKLEKFGLPGGGIDVGEHIEEGLRREFLEETGYTVHLENKLPIFMDHQAFYWRSKDQYNWAHIMIFEVILDERQPQQLDLVEAHEIGELKWMKLDEINDENLHHMYPPFFEQLRSE